MSKIKERVVATVTLHRMEEFGPIGRRKVAKWLRAHADDLERRDKARRVPFKYGPRFIGRFIVPA